MTLAILFGLLAAIGFGSSAVLARLGLQRIPPTFGVFLSLSTGFLLTFALSIALHFRDILDLTPRAFLWFLFFRHHHLPPGPPLQLHCHQLGRSLPLLPYARR